jgi:hypothetical protein
LGTQRQDTRQEEGGDVKKTLYAGLGLVTWKIGKRYVRQRARQALAFARR